MRNSVSRDVFLRILHDTCITHPRGKPEIGCSAPFSPIRCPLGTWEILIDSTLSGAANVCRC